ncbi:MAG: ABC transporter ATP-binding protein [Ignavibacteriales bacterium]
MNGLSIYLTIPLLDTLFLKDKASTSTNLIKNKTNAISFDWFQNIKQQISDAFNSFIFSGDILSILFKICSLILIAFILKNIFHYLQEYFLAYAEQGIIKDIRNKLYDHLHKLPMSYFKDQRTGDLISRITNDVTVIQASVSAIFLSLFKEPLTIFVFIFIAVTISWQLTLISFLILPFSILIIAVIGSKLRKQTVQLNKSIGWITTILNETISGIKIVKAFNMESYEIKKFEHYTQRYFKKILKRARLRAISGPTTEIIGVAVGIVIIFYGGKLVIVDKELEASKFLGFLFSIFQILPSLKQMSGINNKVQEAIAAGYRIFEVLDTEPAIKDPENPVSLTEFKRNIEFENVSFKYEDSDELILDKINFSAEKGKIIALVGSSGAGKTTLVDLLARYYDPIDGSIKIDGIDIKSLKLFDVRKFLGIVTQETVLFNESVKNNIAYGLKDYPMEKIIEVSKAANAHNFIMELPHQYDTIIGERGTKLSGGQRQRISIARALLKNPPIMILDEATSSLDNESEILVQEAIERLMDNRTTFVIAHRLSTVRNADLILVLDKGRIVQRGNHEQLIQINDGIYKRLYELQFREV